MTLVPVFSSLCAASLVAAVACSEREPASCQYNILSSTVVAAYCSHRDGSHELVDRLIAWRGQPGWFGDGATGGGGTRRFGAGTSGRVSQSARYQGFTIAFDADFDAGTVGVGDVTVTLRHENAILIDHVERGDAQLMSKLWIDPDLPLGVDVNLVMAQRSRELRTFLRCELPMPAASPRRIQPRP